MTTYVIEQRRAEVAFPFVREYSNCFRLALDGEGYLAGTYPDGITTVEGVPTSAEVRVLLRKPSGEPGDGVVVATTQSGVDGTWEITGLPVGFLYDVVGRLDGQNDVIMAGVTPKT